MGDINSDNESDTFFCLPAYNFQSGDLRRYNAKVALGLWNYDAVSNFLVKMNAFYVPIQQAIRNNHFLSNKVLNVLIFPEKNAFGQNTRTSIIEHIRRENPNQNLRFRRNTPLQVWNLNQSSWSYGENDPVFKIT